MIRKQKSSEQKADREGERAGLIGPYVPAEEGPTCCGKALYGGCEHQLKGRWVPQDPTPPWFEPGIIIFIEDSN